MMATQSSKFLILIPIFFPPRPQTSRNDFHPVWPSVNCMIELVNSIYRLLIIFMTPMTWHFLRTVFSFLFTVIQPLIGSTSIQLQSFGYRDHDRLATSKHKTVCTIRQFLSSWSFKRKVIDSQVCNTSCVVKHTTVLAAKFIVLGLNIIMRFIHHRK